MGRKILFVMSGLAIFLAGWASAQMQTQLEQTTVHAVAWTATEAATNAQHEAFEQATQKLLSTMPGLRRAWVGQLREPLTAGNITRTHGLILEFDTMASRMAYSDHPARAPWAKVWSEVRVPGSTNFDVGSR